MYTLDVIKSLLEITDKTQKDLCDYLGLEKGTFSAWNGNRSQSYKKYIPQIADFFNVSTDYLLGKTDEKNSPSIGAVTEKVKEFVDILSVLPEDEQAEALKYIRYLRSQVSLQKSPEIK